jgi:polysaccharide biosynthesis transport protein
MANPALRRKDLDSGSGNQIDFRACYYLVRERLWLVVLCLLVAALGVAAYLVRAPRIFASRAVLQVEQQDQKILNIEQVQREDWQSQESLKTVEQTLQNRALLERVMATNHLASDRRFNPPADGKSATHDERVRRLAEMVSVKLRKGTRLIDIVVEHTDAGLAQLVADSLIKEFLLLNYEHSYTASKDATVLLQGEADRLKKKLETSENALQAYREQTKSVSLEDRQNVVVQRLQELSAKVTEAKSQRIANESAWKQVQELGGDIKALQVVPAVASLPSIIEIRSQIAKLESEFANLKQRYREKHPKYIQAQSQLADWNRTLEKAVLDVPQTIKSAYESSRAAELALETALREQENAALELNRQAIRYNVLLRDVESDRALYQAVLNRIKETTVTEDIQPTKVRIIQAATHPEKPDKPQKIKIALLGLLAGLALGLGLVFFLSSIDQSIKTVDQAEEQLGLPVLSTVPRFNGVPQDQRRLIVADEAHSSEAESFRTLRTALSMLGRKEDRKTFLFTSALPAEGKTFCSLNYALSLSQQGLRTVVIDCDLRRPMVEKTILSNNKRGFGVTDYITAQKGFEDVVHATAFDHLFFIPAGTTAPNPAELLAKTGIDGLIEEALLHYDRVIVDSAPIHAVSDTLLILNRIQTLCLVVRARKTPGKAIRRAIRLLHEAQAPLAGVLLNLMPRRRGGYGYYYDSYYDYSYRGKYAEKKECSS